MAESQLEDDLQEIYWSLTSMLHRRMTHLQKRLDDAESEVRDMIHVQDGSEVKSTELERAQSKAFKLASHCDAYEQMRDVACEHFSSNQLTVAAPKWIEGIVETSLPRSWIVERIC